MEMRRKREEEEEEEENKSSRCRHRLHLPDDLVREILLRLPAKAVGRFRCASKTWLSISASTSFVHAHARRAPKSFLLQSLHPFLNIECHNYNNLQLLPAAGGKAPQAYTRRDLRTSDEALASCDGLIFLRARSAHPRAYYYVLNPLTGFQIDLPKPPTPPLNQDSGYGFYFHRWSGEYRLLNFYGGGGSHSKTEVLSLGAGDSWRPIEATAPVLRFFYWHSSVLVNDCLHWFCEEAPGHGLQAILVFDIREETFSLMKLPPYFTKTRLLLLENALAIELGIVDMEGKLGCWIARKESGCRDDLRIDLWIAGDAGGEADHRWRKMYSVCCAGGCQWIFHPDWWLWSDVRTAVYIRGGELLFLFESMLVQWDLKAGKYYAERVLNDHDDQVCAPALIYTESLLSPDFHF